MEIKPGKSETISFRPLTEGLGLNHFVDGMPYSPAPEAARARTALKSQRPATPPPRATIPSVNDVFAAMPMISSAVASAAATASLPATAAWGPLAKSAPAAVHATSPAIEVIMPTMPATAWRRIGAFTVDVFAAAGLALLVAATAFRINGYDMFELLQTHAGITLITPMTLFVVVFSCGYFLLQEVTWRRTFGKALFGIRLESPSAFAVLGRAFCFPFAVMPLGIGLIWFAFDARKRCWHDAVTETDVIIG